jgi:predicted amidohydrolase
VFFEKIIEARAIENTVFFSYTNLVGTELNMVFWGGNSVIGPRGEIKAKGEYYKEGLVTCEINYDDLQISREHRPTIKSTNLDLFEELQTLLGKEQKGTDET